MEWIHVQDQSPKRGQIVVAWLSRQREPVCVRYEMDKIGPLWRELVDVDRMMDREDIVTHWMPLPKSPPKLKTHEAKATPP